MEHKSIKKGLNAYAWVTRMCRKLNLFEINDADAWLGSFL